MRHLMLLLILLVPVSWMIGRDLYNKFWPEKKEEDHEPEARSDVHDGR